MVKSITAADFNAAYHNTPLAIIDVRAKADFDERHIPHALNIPLEELASSLDGLTHETEYFLMCYSGNRSAVAGELLAAQNYNVTNILGGMAEWSGETVSKNSK